MKTKTIPFDLETVKKIQAGEIKGRVMSNNAEVLIIDLDMYFQGKHYICAQILDNGGTYITSLYNTDGTDADFMAGYGLYIELQHADNKRQFKPFDKVLVRKNDDDGQYWQPKTYSFFHPAFKEHVTTDGMMYEVVLPYEGNEHLVGTTNKPKEE